VAELILAARTLAEVSLFTVALLVAAWGGGGVSLMAGTSPTEMWAFASLARGVSDFADCAGEVDSFIARRFFRGSDGLRSIFVPKRRF
jgi:hypothetical protein